MPAPVKGCLMPALSRGCAMRRGVRGQESDKPQGGKPRDGPARPGQARALWGFDCWQSSRSWQLGQWNVMEVDGTCNGVAAIADFLLMHRSRGTLAHRKAKPSAIEASR